jgi:hypothetical protein
MPQPCMVVVGFPGERVAATAALEAPHEPKSERPRSGNRGRPASQYRVRVQNPGTAWPSGNVTA